MSNNLEYNESQIQVLEGLEAVRKKTGYVYRQHLIKRLASLVYEIVDNSVDEALANRCNSIEVIIHKDNSISVLDDGYGIPVGIHPQKGIPAVTVVLPFSTQEESSAVVATRCPEDFTVLVHPLLTHFRSGWKLPYIRTRRSITRDMNAARS